MRFTFVVPAAIALLFLGSLAQADVFNLGSGLTNLETVRVGDAGNTADTAVHSGMPPYDTSPGAGSVAYNYNIGKYKVTAAQYCDFLNHKANGSDRYGLYNSDMSWCGIEQSGDEGSYTYYVSRGGGYENRPVNSVSYWDACRFANWVNNGQGDGDTETGAYTLTTDGISYNSVTRNANWTWAVTSEDEWYKAAYYKGGSLDAGYWLYPTQSDSIDTTMANYGWSVGHTTSVGAYAYPSAYGTYDQGGNLFEWNEAIRSGTTRGLRGGPWFDSSVGLQSSNRYHFADPTTEYGAAGFRLSYLAPVPEPSPMIALLGGLAGLLGIRRRSA